jgi:hypothetical protein
LFGVFFEPVDKGLTLLRNVGLSSDVSEEHVPSIFRDEEYVKQETSVKSGGTGVTSKQTGNVMPTAARRSNPT